LQRKLDEVRREKAALEMQIEREKQAHQIMVSELDKLRSTSTKNSSHFQSTVEAEEEMEEED
jgi:uncharacterized protein YigA (DUF484 family)